MNANAGGLLGADGAELLPKELAGSFNVTSEQQGDLPDRLQRARNKGADLVVVAGGDGTLACAASVLANTGIPLGIIPAGTANLLARDLGIPLDDRQAAISVLRQGSRRTIDVGDIAGQTFLCAVMLGSPARLGHHRELGRKRGNGPAAWLHLARAAIRAARRHRAQTFSVTVDGVSHRLRTPSLNVTVNPLDDSTGRLFARTDLARGELCLYAVQPRSLAGFLRMAWNTARGRFADDPAVVCLKGEQIDIAGRTASIRLMVDGEEHLMANPVRIRIMKRALTVIAPPA
jgi:diacylglycerol kinase family enzyme